MSQSLTRADPADTRETREAAARRYLGATDMHAMMDDILKASTQKLPPDKQAEVMTLIKRHVSFEKLQGLTMAAMIKHFTTRELEALADFDGLPEGKSAMRKFGAYMADVMPIVMEEMRTAVAGMQAEIAEKKKQKPADVGT